MSKVLTARISVELERELDSLAKNTQRAKSWLVSDALRFYIDANKWQVEAIKEGLAEAKEGRGVSNAEVEAWLQTWGQPNEKAPPKWK